MAETYDTTIPTEAELQSTFRGVPFEEFKQLTEDEVHELTQWIPRGDESGWLSDDEFGEVIEEVVVLGNFRKWRRGGIPDRNVSHEELEVYMDTLIASRLSRDPSYGAAPRLLDNVSPEEEWLIDMVLDYATSNYPAYHRPLIFESTLLRLADDKYVDVLEKYGVLEKIGQDPIDGRVYELAGPFYDYWLVEQQEAD